jgi:hypothetical protein
MFENDASVPAVWNVNVSDLIGKENVPFLNDVIRMLALQVVIQMMLHVTDPVRYSFTDGDFIVLAMFIVVAVSAYWLVLRRLVEFS